MTTVLFLYLLNFPVVPADSFATSECATQPAIRDFCVVSFGLIQEVLG